MMEKRAGRRTAQRKRGQRVTLGPREKRRLGQLFACLVLFGIVFFAKGIDALAGLRQELSATLRSDADLKTAFADFGRSVASGADIGDTLGDLWVDVFLAQEREAPAIRSDGPLYRSAVRELSTGTALPTVLLRSSPVEETSPVEDTTPAEDMTSTEDPLSDSAAEEVLEELSELPTEEPPAEAEPAVVYVEYTGPALPDNATMDRYALGLTETVSPVMAPLSSGFGWREHPIDGDEKFHYGLDLAANTGTPVLAFAAGKVDYIGESEVYGQYLQIDHGDGITSFYAHCSALLVQQGQTVEAGEKVALSGGTGRVTGPHLHFELKRDGVRLNPIYYIETLS